MSGCAIPSLSAGTLENSFVLSTLQVENAKDDAVSCQQEERLRRSTGFSLCSRGGGGGALPAIQSLVWEAGVFLKTLMLVVVY